MAFSPKQKELLQLIEQKTRDLLQKGHRRIIPVQNHGRIQIESIDPKGIPVISDISGYFKPQIGLRETILASGAVGKAIREIDRNLRAPLINEDMEEGGNLFKIGNSALLYLFRA